VSRPGPVVDARTAADLARSSETFKDGFRVRLQFVGDAEERVERRDRRRLVARLAAAVGAAVVFVAVAFAGVSFLTRQPATPPAAPAPVVTLPPAEVAARAEIAPTCGPWLAFDADLPATDRPDPSKMKPIVDAIYPHLASAAGAVPEYAAARDEVEYLKGYAVQRPGAIERESIGRISYAMQTVSAACTRATSTR